jgi:hypothetical protein
MKPTTRKLSYTGKINPAALFTSALTFIALMGCGSLSATAQDQPDPNDPPQFDKLITIYYTAKDGCAKAPDYVDDPFFEVDKGKKIGWASADGTTAFKIYFSPFAGDVINGTNGQTPPQTIPQEPPGGVTYKYTVVTDAAGCDKYPLDPYFRIR